MMKKSDPTGSGVTIEYPETRPSGNFPFGGFWASAIKRACNIKDFDHLNDTISQILEKK